MFLRKFVLTIVGFVLVIGFNSAPVQAQSPLEKATTYYGGAIQFNGNATIVRNGNGFSGKFALVINVVVLSEDPLIYHTEFTEIWCYSQDCVDFLSQTIIEDEPFPLEIRFHEEIVSDLVIRIADSYQSVPFFFTSVDFFHWEIDSTVIVRRINGIIPDYGFPTDDAIFTLNFVTP